MSRYNRHRRDGNHSAVLSDLEALGFGVWDTSQTALGIDALVVKAGRVTPVEIKDGRLSRSRRELTEHEQAMHAKFLAYGVRVEVLTGPDDYEVLGRAARGRREG